MQHRILIFGLGAIAVLFLFLIAALIIGMSIHFYASEDIRSNFTWEELLSTFLGGQLFLSVLFWWLEDWLKGSYEKGGHNRNIQDVVLDAKETPIPEDIQEPSIRKLILGLKISLILTASITWSLSYMAPKWMILIGCIVCLMVILVTVGYIFVLIAQTIPTEV